MKVVVELSDMQVEYWMRQAIILGYKKEEPRKAWTEQTKKDCIRYGINKTSEGYDGR